MEGRMEGGREARWDGVGRNVQCVGECVASVQDPILQASDPIHKNNFRACRVSISSIIQQQKKKKKKATSRFVLCSLRLPPAFFLLGRVESGESGRVQRQ